MLLQPVRRNEMPRRSGFTLIEVLVVVAIIVILAGAGAVAYMKYLEDARVSQAKLECHEIAKALQSYQVQQNADPASLDELLNPPSGKPYCEQKLLTDPWHKPYQFNLTGERFHQGGNMPDVWTTAPDGKEVGNFDSR